MSNLCTWGSSQFEVCNPNGNWNRAPGVYVFAAIVGNQWYPLYIGESESFKDRFDNHEKMDEAYRRGMTHIHALVVNNYLVRLAIERELIELYRPPMNTHFK